MQTIVQNGKRAVSIYANTEAGPFEARLYVNCEAGQLGDATLTRTKRASLASVTKWARQQVTQ